MIINKKSGTSIMLVLLLLMPVFLPLRADAYDLKSLTKNSILRDTATRNSLISGSGARAIFHKISNDEINFDISLIEKLGSVYKIKKPHLYGMRFLIDIFETMFAFLLFG